MIVRGCFAPRHDGISQDYSFNIDFGGCFHSNLLRSYGAASGSNGTWIRVDGGYVDHDKIAETTHGLQNVLGVSTSVSLSVIGRGDCFNSQTSDY